MIIVKAKEENVQVPSLGKWDFDIEQLEKNAKKMRDLDKKEKEFAIQD